MAITTDQSDNSLSSMNVSLPCIDEEKKNNDDGSSVDVDKKEEKGKEDEEEEEEERKKQAEKESSSREKQNLVRTKCNMNITSHSSSVPSFFLSFIRSMYNYSSGRRQRDKKRSRREQRRQ